MKNSQKGQKEKKLQQLLPNKSCCPALVYQGKVNSGCTGFSPALLSDNLMDGTRATVGWDVSNICLSYFSCSSEPSTLSNEEYMYAYR